MKKNSFNRFLSAVAAVILALGMMILPVYAADGEIGGTVTRELPSWYPEDPQNFEFFSDPTAPRVVDNADIFSDDEEALIAARASIMAKEIGKDIVILTDNTTYGFSRDVYAADFYDFNGYGVGPEREGFCLLISMEEGNRGFWTCCTGSDTMALYTEEWANELDDVLYDFMVNGSYGPGVYDWIGNIRNLCVTGVPFPPYWYPEDPSTYVHAADPSAPRVIDEAGVLTASEIADLTKQAKALSEKHQKDVVLLFAGDTSHLVRRQYIDDFYYYRGYGLGKDFDGVILTVFKYSGTVYMTGFGSGAEYHTEVNVERLENHAQDAVAEGKYADAAATWMKEWDRMQKTHRAPKNLSDWMGSLGVSGILGTIVGLFSIGSARSKMKTVHSRRSAGEYLKKDSLRVDPVKDEFVYRMTSRTYSPQTESSSGGSSGGSSYSSSYHGSSGSSHSGSGRSF